MAQYTKHFTPNPVATPQNQVPFGREPEMQKNAAGGYAFKADKWTMLRRFAVMGSEGGTYYESEHDLTIQNATSVMTCIAEDGLRVVREIVEISVSGKALKVSPCIFVLALCATFEASMETQRLKRLAVISNTLGSDGFTDAENAKLAVESIALNTAVEAARATRRGAYAAVAQVCRTASHLMEFTETIKGVNGGHAWGRLMRSTVGNWYTSRTSDALAYQIVKYRTRNGYSHRDILRLAHVEPDTEVQAAILGWAAGKREKLDALIAVGNGDNGARWAGVGFIEAFEKVQTATLKLEVCKLIRDFNLPREAIPDQWLKEPDVWEALVEKMPITALIRSLNKITALGLIAPFSATAKFVESTLSNSEIIKRGRVHPLTVLKALKQYQLGKGDKGSLTWTPAARVVDALDTCFNLSFDTIEPINRNVLVGVDVSASMSSHAVSGVSNLMAIEAAAAVAMVYQRAQPQSEMVAFEGTIRADFKVTPQMRLADVVRYLASFRGGSTNCALPAQHALQQGWPVDGLILITDGESWRGDRHTFEAISALRGSRPNGLRAVLLQTEASQTTLIDPKDSDAMELPGFSADVLAISNLFIGGEI